MRAKPLSIVGPYKAPRDSSLFQGLCTNACIGPARRMHAPLSPLHTQSPECDCSQGMFITSFSVALTDCAAPFSTKHWARMPRHRGWLQISSCPQTYTSTMLHPVGAQTISTSIDGKPVALDEPIALIKAWHVTEGSELIPAPSVGTLGTSGSEKGHVSSQWTR